MATTFTSNYYPPIVDTYLPAFICDADNSFSVKIYFSLSPYTDYNHSQQMHIKVVDQQTNKSVLKYSSGLKLNGIVWIDKDRTTDDKYYVVLSSDDFKDGAFSPYKYYKVQLRSTEKNESEDSNDTAHLYRTTSIYSEWSTVCLIRGIREPELKIKYFQNDSERATGVQFNSNTVTVRGELAFPGEGDYSKVPENIKSYRIKFYDKNNTLIDDSEDLFPPITNLRSISYDAKYTFESDEETYKMVITVLTTGLYEHTENFLFSIKNTDEPQTLVSGFMYSDINNGTVNIQINTSTSDHQEVILYIRRTSSESNFKRWEDIYSVRIPPAIDVPSNASHAWSMTWEDCTIESGVWYQYGFQTKTYPSDLRTNNEILKRKTPTGWYRYVGPNQDYYVLENGAFVYKKSDWIEEDGELKEIKNGDYRWEEGNTSAFIHEDNLPIGSDIIPEGYDPITGIGDTENKIILVFDDSFLVGKDGQQLKITYDNTLDSLKYTQYISKTDTIGSKYPFIRQNAVTCYRTFTISGLITFLQDENGFFISDNDLFINENIKDLYDIYNDREKITKYNDYVKERRFREKVMNFLINDNVKLYRSTTEGNILVKLTDVSFNPKVELGRYLYSFSATAVECGECNIDNYAKYNINRKSAESYDLISQFNNSKYRTRISKIVTAPSSMTPFNVSLKKGEGIKKLLLNAEWLNNNIKGKVIDFNGDISYADNVVEALTEEYNLKEINPYWIEFKFINPIPQGDNLTFTVHPKKDGSTFTASSDLYTFGSLDNLENIAPDDISSQISNPEPMTFDDIIFNQDTQLNINCCAQLVYESIKSEVYKKVGNTYDWVEVEDETDTPEIIVINDVAYTVGQLEAINNEYEAINHNWFYDDQDQRKDLIEIAQNKWEEELENQESASFDIYQIQIQDFPQGLVARAIYTNDDVAKTFVIGRTYSLDLNLDDDTPDTYVAFNSFYFLGQLICSNDCSLSPLHFDDSRVQIDGDKTYWKISDQERYPISFYKNLNFEEADRETATYGIIDGYMDASQFTSSQILFFGRSGTTESQGG